MNNINIKYHRKTSISKTDHFYPALKIILMFSNVYNFFNVNFLNIFEALEASEEVNDKKYAN